MNGAEYGLFGAVQALGKHRNVLETTCLFNISAFLKVFRALDAHFCKEKTGVLKFIF
jgi:hypothetical protein